MAKNRDEAAEDRDKAAEDRDKVQEIIGYLLFEFQSTQEIKSSKFYNAMEGNRTRDYVKRRLNTAKEILKENYDIEVDDSKWGKILLKRGSDSFRVKDSLEQKSSIDRLSRFIVQKYVDKNDDDTETWLLDIGRTMNQIAYEISEHKERNRDFNLNVVTYSYTPNFHELSKSGINVEQLGGKYNHQSWCCIDKIKEGEDTGLKLKWYTMPSKTFLTGTCLSSGGLIADSEDTTDIKKQLIKASEALYIVVDSSKLQEKEGGSIITYCGLEPDEWLGNYHMSQKKSKLSNKASIPLEIITDLPKDKEPEDLPFFKHVTQSVSIDEDSGGNRYCIYKGKIHW